MVCNWKTIKAFGMSRYFFPWGVGGVLLGVIRSQKLLTLLSGGRNFRVVATMGTLQYYGRFPFDQKFRKFRVWERMEQTFSGISFRNFGCTSRGWPKIPENRNNRKIPFHSTIPARAQFLRARKSNSTWLPILLLNISVPLVIMRQMT